MCRCLLFRLLRSSLFGSVISCLSATPRVGLVAGIGLKMNCFQQFSDPSVAQAGSESNFLPGAARL